MKPQLNLPVVDIDAIIDDIKSKVDSVIPSRLDELNGKQVIFCNDISLIPTHGWENDATDEIIITRIEPLSIEACIVGIDSSCLLVGETVDGFIYSAKCCVALACNGKMVHAKIGPMLFYVKEDNDISVNRCGIDESKRIIRRRLEQMLQYEISRSIHDSIILADGPLKAFHSRELFNIIDTCKANNNILIGLSKGTSYKHLSRIASSLTKQAYPCYTDVRDLLCNDGIREDIRDLSILLAKLNGNGVVVRVDIPSIYDPSYALGVLIGNERLYNGYPDTLRVAHHASVFTSMDLLCLKGFMKSRLGVREVDGDHARRLLIGKAC